jgi:hypothetical protein
LQRAPGLANNLIHIFCAELPRAPLLVVSIVAKVTIQRIKPRNQANAKFLLTEIKLIEINDILRPGMPCAQSYQQNMGINGHNFCLPKTARLAGPCAIFKLWFYFLINQRLG